jgi:phosphate starvation-inducible membrane PsiE
VSLRRAIDDDEYHAICSSYVLFFFFYELEAWIKMFFLSDLFIQPKINIQNSLVDALLRGMLIDLI